MVLFVFFLWGRNLRHREMKSLAHLAGHVDSTEPKLENLCSGLLKMSQPRGYRYCLICRLCLLDISHLLITFIF